MKEYKVVNGRAVEVNQKPEIAMRLGVDLGQMRDYTTVIVNQFDQTNDRHRIFYIERPALGTRYPDILKRVEEIASEYTEEGDRPNADGPRIPGTPPEIYVDVTGLGRPVVDEMKARGLRRVTAVTIVAGESVSKPERGELHIGKQALVSRLHVLLAGGRLRFSAKTDLGLALKDELHNFALKVSPDANLLFEARPGSHDDLVIALMLATWQGPRKKSVGVW